MSQLVYNLAPAVGYEGGIAASFGPHLIVPRLAEGLIPVGKLVAPGTNSMIGPPINSISQFSTNPGQIIPLPAGLAANPMVDSAWLGIPIYDATNPPYDVTIGYSCYGDKDEVPVLVKGGIYVVPESGAINAQGDVYVRTSASGGNTILGKFAPAAGTGLVLFPRGRFVSGLMQGNLAVLLVW